MDLFFKKYLCLFWIIFFISNVYAQQNKPIVCDQMYALCTSARCIPSPENPAAAFCECVTEKGASVGFTSCEKRKPVSREHKVLSIVSTFSFAQFDSKKSMSCPTGMPWANCVDMPCTVDPQNEKRALCLCKLNATKPFFTFGGSCDTNTCATGFWSGATSGEESELLRNALMQSTHSNVKPSQCDMPSTDKDAK